MATVNQNLSEFEFSGDASLFKIGIVISEWNPNITQNLLKGAKQKLLDNKVAEQNIFIKNVPGTFELALGCQWLFENEKPDGVIAIGSVIQGETRHFDFVCEGATKGIMDVSLKFSKPVIFCVLTDNTLQQAIDRSGGKHGNKGVESAVACLKMISQFKKLP